MRRGLLALGMALVLGVLPASADVLRVPVGDPLPAMQQVYARLEKGADVAIDLPLSARLKGLMALESREHPKDAVGRLDFDYFINGQDGDISQTQITQRTIDGAPDRRIIVARFMNAGQAMENHFYFEKENGAWVLDDVRAVDARDGGWTLSLILKYGWDEPDASAAVSAAAAAEADRIAAEAEAAASHGAAAGSQASGPK